MEIKDLTPEQRKEVEESIKDARWAIRWSGIQHIALCFVLLIADVLICKSFLPQENYKLGINFICFLTLILILCSMYDNLSKTIDQLREEIQNIVGNK